MVARRISRFFLSLALAVSLAAFPACSYIPQQTAPVLPPASSAPIDLASVPAFSGDPFVEIDGNVPAFSQAERSLESCEVYSPLDELGRCGTALALVGPETMPTEERGSIDSVKPSGWHLAKYDIVDGTYLYNRCHLIAFRLAGENANELNLVTGTRFMNVRGMVPFEDEVADYVNRTGNHVLYRATPVFEGDELVARGIHLEAFSVEDDGMGVAFNVFVYNAQPGIVIDYATGESQLDGTLDASNEFDASQYAYVLNITTKRLHRPDCSSVAGMKASNREGFNGTRDEALARGFEPCGRCKP